MGEREGREREGKGERDIETEHKQVKEEKA